MATCVLSTCKQVDNALRVVVDGHYCFWAERVITLESVDKDTQNEYQNETSACCLVAAPDGKVYFTEPRKGAIRCFDQNTNTVSTLAEGFWTGTAQRGGVGKKTPFGLAYRDGMLYV